MLKCLSCYLCRIGTAVASCECGGTAIPVSQSLAPVAEVLHKLGFELAKAEATINVVVHAGAIETSVINIEFARIYDDYFFGISVLPEMFLHHAHRNDAGEMVSRVIHTCASLPARGDISRWELKRATHALTAWAEHLEGSEALDLLHSTEPFICKSMRGLQVLSATPTSF